MSRVELADRTSLPDELAAQSIQALIGGDLAGAELAARQALIQDPKHLSAQTNLGATLLAQGRFGESESIFSDLAQREPQSPPHWINLGNARRGMGDYDAALRAYARAASLGCREPDFLFNLGLTHLDRGDYESARHILDEARNKDPADAEITFRYADACYRSLYNEAAVAALSEWRGFLPTRPGILAQMAQLLVNLGQQSEGDAALQIALSDPDADAITFLTAIEITERTNRLQEAQALIGRLESAPHSAEIDKELLIIRARLAQRLGDLASAEQLYSQSLLTNTDVALKHVELFPLAATLDALGRYDDATRILREAHASQLQYLRRIAPTLVLMDAPTMAITRARCDPEDVAEWRDNAPGLENSPIFIVAFPRSGTTLLELTLDSHPGVQSMDEQPFIQNSLDDMRALAVEYPHRLAGLTQQSLNDLRANYYRRVATKIHLDGDARLVDKNPLNILRLPVICRLFPHSPIILAVRNPLDVILSCYMQHFRAPEFALLCNSLPSIARAYRLTMDFWFSQIAVLQPRVIEVRYETLVENFSAEARGLMTFLELPWDDRVLEPGAHARAKGFISTPSYSQVVGPVTAKAVDRWRRYSSLIEPLIPIVEPYLHRWNYAAVVAVDGVSPNNR